MNKYLLLLILFLGMQSGIAQVRLTQNPADRLLEQAVQKMQVADYEGANEIFRDILNKGYNIPAEMPYYFAETLYMIKQYFNSKNFLDKYFEINETNGDNYEKALELNNLLKAPLLSISNCKLCDTKGYLYEICGTCKGAKESTQTCNLCRGIGIISCTTCSGKGVITKVNALGIKEFYECTRCESKGRLTCTKCEGSKLIFTACMNCGGAGKVAGTSICTHEGADLDHDHEGHQH